MRNGQHPQHGVGEQAVFFLVFDQAAEDADASVTDMEHLRVGLVDNIVEGNNGEVVNLHNQLLCKTSFIRFRQIQAWELLQLETDLFGAWLNKDCGFLFACLC